jgi:UDP:flavonoid glycosyltransferase YjiC (YdhE family)
MKFLFTTLFTDDLGLITRTLPIAKELANRGHSIAYCNPSKAPIHLIEDAGIENIPIDLTPSTKRSPSTSEVWDMGHFAASFGCLDENFVRRTGETLTTVLNDYDADVVVDAWNFWACLAAKILHKPLVTIIQADHHPANQGLIWWKKPPAGVPNAVSVFNKVLIENGLPVISKVEDLLVGDVTLVLGIPETDPLPEDAPGTHIGPILWQNPDAKLPDALAGLDQELPMVWLYSGNPQYGPQPGWADSAVVLRACVEALGQEEIQVVVSTGYHMLPDEFLPLPGNFHFEPFVPGLSMAEQSDLLIHHGGYGSCQTGLYTGTPAVIIPTYSERESNARRIAEAGAGEFVLPMEDTSGSKSVQAELVREKVLQVLSDSSYVSKAKSISEKMRTYGGTSEAASRIERFSM